MTPTQPPPIFTYMATVAPGLEPVAISEICTKLPSAWVQNQLRGRVLFNTDAPWEKLQNLKCVDNLYLHIAWLKVGPHKIHLADLSADIENTPMHHLPFMTTAGPGTKIVVNASRSGQHTFSRFDAANAVLEGLSMAHRFIPGTVDSHDLNFRLDIIDTDALFSLKLTDSTFRFRGKRAFSPAALRPPIAHALIWISNPQPTDTFLDPFCGSGTIPIERGAYEALSITGGDSSPEAVAVAEDNAPSHIQIMQMDARDLTNLAPSSITTIVSNLPWGKQIAPGEDITGLYSRFFQEMDRILTSHGRAILLTDQENAIETACKVSGLEHQPICTVSLHGALPVVYQVTRK
ncbi:MAG: hypothetical protein GX986_00210 [Firmicutes bacterium]|nr:hypothetical protein [Bacillota bacterium]